MRPSLVFLAAVALLTCAVVPPAAAVTRNVPADHSDIASALAASVAGDEVVVAAGTYREHDLILPSGVALRGATGNPVDVVIDGARAGRCVYGTGLSAATRIEALTLANGLPAYGSTPDKSWGGGLYVNGGDPAVLNCIFTGNETAIGGGAFVKGTGAPAFIGCVFDRNEATETAGLLLRGTCNPVVEDCVFRNGMRTMVGGGLTWAGAGHALIEDCTFEDNDVWETGGGVEVFGSSALATLRDCVIRRNSAVISGAGLWVGNHGRVILERCSIVGNRAEDKGAGVFLDGAFLDAFESTILGNTAPLLADGVVSSGSTATLDCCAFAPGGWGGSGMLTVVSDNCPVAGGTTSWGDVKAMYRP